VTGEFPGLVNRVFEYADQHTSDFEGVYPYGMAVIGNRLYILASNHIGGYTDSYYWFDVYDISDPLHPTWLNAAESNSAGPIFASGQYLYSYQGDLEVPTGSFGGVTLYSVQSGVPVLVGKDDGKYPIAALSRNTLQNCSFGALHRQPLRRLIITVHTLAVCNVYWKRRSIPLPNCSWRQIDDPTILSEPWQTAIKRQYEKCPHLAHSFLLA